MADQSTTGTHRRFRQLATSKTPPMRTLLPWITLDTGGTLRIMGSVSKHTTIDLDEGLVSEAGRVLGTSGNGETVRAALREVVRAHRRLALLDLSSDLSLDDLDEMRRARFGS